MKNVLSIISKKEFRDWLTNNSEKETECWVRFIRKKPNEIDFTYLDAVYEEICFVWIDSVQFKKIGAIFQRFSPRTKKSHWTELNKERARYLIKFGLMTEKGIKVCPTLELKDFKPDKEIEKILKKINVLNYLTLFHFFIKEFVFQILFFIKIKINPFLKKD